MKSPNDRKFRLRPTKSRGTRGTWSTTQGKSPPAAEVRGCLGTLPKPSHNLLVRVVVMRPFLILVAMVVSGSAQAYPWRFPQYPPYGGQYAPPALARSPASIAHLRRRSSYRCEHRILAPLWPSSRPPGLGTQ